VSVASTVKDRKTFTIRAEELKSKDYERSFHVFAITELFAERIVRAQ
jgi:hypothetical protein